MENGVPNTPHGKNHHLGTIVLFVILVGAVYLTLNSRYETIRSPFDFGSTALKQADPTEGWKLYQSTAYGYEVKYPKDWRCRTATGATGVVYCSLSYSTVVFEPQDTSLRGGLEGIEVSVLNTSFANVLEALETDSYRKSPIRDIVLQGGSVGKKATITGGTGDVHEVVIVELDAKRTIRFTTTTDPIADQILATFKFIP